MVISISYFLDSMSMNRVDITNRMNFNMFSSLQQTHINALWRFNDDRCFMSSFHYLLGLIALLNSWVWRLLLDPSRDFLGSALGPQNLPLTWKAPCCPRAQRSPTSEAWTRGVFFCLLSLLMVIRSCCCWFVDVAVDVWFLVFFGETQLLRNFRFCLTSMVWFTSWRHSWFLDASAPMLQRLRTGRRRLRGIAWLPASLQLRPSCAAVAQTFVLVLWGGAARWGWGYPHGLPPWLTPMGYPWLPLQQLRAAPSSTSQWWKVSWFCTNRSRFMKFQKVLPYISCWFSQCHAGITTTFEVKIVQSV